MNKESNFSNVFKFLISTPGANINNYGHFYVVYRTQVSRDEIVYMKIHRYLYRSINLGP
jgi:hypothetical protein